MKRILIGSAWPYANGSLHIGHIAALLPGDVIAKYYRQKGDDVYLVSGSDCHGTPVAIRAREEKKTTQQISDYYHEEFVQCFERLGFEYDRYGKTSSKEHIDFVQEFHKRLYEGGYVVEKEALQAYCGCCNRFLADRFVVGKCPKCGADARGDQCDACTAVLEPETLVEPSCAECGGELERRPSKHLYIELHRLEGALEEFLRDRPHWRKNAVAFTRRYIDEGLRDRAVTRDIDCGIDVPMEGYEGKKIYIWAENVLGYLSMSKAVCDERGSDFDELWGSGDNIRHYYVHGKDNIPFHTIILPSLLLANGGKWRLPDDVISSEYLTLEGKKISTSRNWAVWAKDIVDRYPADSIRYFMITNGPEKRDADFSWREFVNSHNGELLGAYGNFVNRTLAFVQKYYDGAVPDGEFSGGFSGLFDEVGADVEKGALKDGLDRLFEYIRGCNRFFDAQKPWESRVSNPPSCAQTIYTCVQMIANLCVLLEPFLPFSSRRVQEWLRVTARWVPVRVPAGYKLPETSILFERIDKKAVDEEIARLQ